MKRLIRKAEYTLEYDVDDIINNFDISNLIMDRDSLYGAYKDCIFYDKKSQTNAPLGVWINEDNEYILVDGYHRMIDLLFTSQQYADLEVWEVGYSDYWAYPKEKFEIDFSLQWNGLEDFSDEEGLQDDYEKHYQVAI